MLKFWGHNPIIQWFHSNACSSSFPTELIYSPQQCLPVTSHLCRQCPCFSFPLEIVPVTTHLTSGPLSSFLELFQLLFSAVCLSRHHLKVNEADFLWVRNALWTSYRLGMRTVLFLWLWQTSFAGAVSLLASLYVTHFFLLLYWGGVGGGLCACVSRRTKRLEGKPEAIVPPYHSHLTCC